MKKITENVFFRKYSTIKMHLKALEIHMQISLKFFKFSSKACKKM